MSGAVAVFSGCYAGTSGELASESATARRVQAVSPTVRLVTGAFQAWRVCRQRTPPLATKERPSRTAIVRSAMEPIFDGLVGKSHVALAMRRSRNESILLGRLAPQPRCYGAGSDLCLDSGPPRLTLWSLRVATVSVHQVQQPVGKNRHELVPRTNVVTFRPRGVARATAQGEGADHGKETNRLRYNSVAHLLSLLEGTGDEWATGWVASSAPRQPFSRLRLACFHLLWRV